MGSDASGAQFSQTAEVMSDEIQPLKLLPDMARTLFETTAQEEEYASKSSAKAKSRAKASYHGSLS